MGGKKIDTVHQAISTLQTLSEMFNRRRIQLASIVGLTEQQWLLLEQISEEHFMPSMFARNRESSPAAVSKIIRQLMNKGLVKASIKQEDGRQRRYHLTSKGQQALNDIRIHRQDAIEHIWMKMETKELSVFKTVSEKLIAAIEAYSEANK